MFTYNVLLRRISNMRFATSEMHKLLPSLVTFEGMLTERRYNHKGKCKVETGSHISHLLLFLLFIFRSILFFISIEMLFSFYCLLLWLYRSSVVLLFFFFFGFCFWIASLLEIVWIAPLSFACSLLYVTKNLCTTTLQDWCSIFEGLPASFLAVKIIDISPWTNYSRYFERNASLQ